MVFMVLRGWTPPLRKVALDKSAFQYLSYGRNPTLA